MITTTYHIDELPENLINHNKFVYIDSVDGDLVIKNYKWFLNLNFYVIMNSTLPMNMLTASLVLPFANIDDITINRNLTATIPNWIKQPKLCQVYQTSINLDTGGSNLFQQQLTNYDMYLHFSYDNDDKITTATTFESSNDNIASFLTEWIATTNEINFQYSNYVEVSSSQKYLDNSSEYYLNSVIGTYSKEEIIYYELNNECEDLKKPLKHLLTLHTIDPFIISSTKVNVFYSFSGSDEIYEFKYENSLMEYVYKDFDVNLNIKTSYDPDSHKIQESISGDDGILITDKCSGYYLVKLTINQNENYRTYVFKQSFNFAIEQKQTNISIDSIFINEITNNFQRMVF